MSYIILKYYFISITLLLCDSIGYYIYQTNLYDLFSVVLMSGHLERVCSICKIALGV